MKTPRKQSGVTLLEVLIAILVLSIGMLGMLGLFLNSLKLTTSSSYRSTAAQLAYGLADTMRANMPSVSSYSTVTPAATSSCFTTTGCTAQQMIETEIAAWQAQITASLPGGGGTLCRDSTPNDGTIGAWACDGNLPFTIKVCWDESRIPTSQAIECVRTTL